ncbi:MAG: hypothetical protein GF317_24425 [Candidatus Lokiarchaeota archaeon]|nr:hypothetical protein [Candidatus Lokiarchaeota archaeon]MBD3202520.1 hypothetical protein [Candidatus Lokiarchaeota archaeon]
MEIYGKDVRSKSFFELFSDGIRLFLSNYLKLIVPLFVLSFIPILLNVFLVTDLLYQSNIIAPQYEFIADKMLEENYLPTDSEMELIFRYFILTFGALIIEFLINNFFTILGISLVGFYLVKIYTNHQADLKEEITKGFNNKLVFILLVLGFGLPLGLSFLLIPGIIIFIFYIFTIFTYNEPAFENSFKSAKIIAKGSYWRIIGMAFTSLLVTAIVNLPYQSIIDYIWRIDSGTYMAWLNPATRNFGMLILYQVIYGLISMLLSPLLVCLLTPLYVQSRIKKEALLQTSWKPYTTQSEKSEGFKVKKGIYCPFCGFFISEISDACPNCGRSLEFMA